MGRKLSYDEVKEYIESFGYTLLSKEYVNNNQKLNTICPNGHEYIVSFRKFREDRRCRKCNMISDKDIDNVIKESGYELISYHRNYNKLRLLVKCKDENHEPYEVNYQDFKKGKRCIKCTNNEKYTYDYVREYCSSKNFTLISDEYIKSNSLLKLKCNECGCEFNGSFNCIKNGNKKCPKCNESKGEKEVRLVLEKYKIKFLTQHKFDDCIYDKKLPFDFYISQYNTLIEYDGEQHFEPIDFAGKGEEWAMKKFEKQLVLDNIKNIYCKVNNIKLIRIPYWEFDNIEQILIKELNLKLRRKGNIKLK